MKTKKAQEFSVTTLVVIVLAIIVLVVLALGFGTGWTNLWSKISGYFQPVNVDSTKQACQYACTTQANYDYCCNVRQVTFTKGENPTLMTCFSGKAQLQTDCDINCDVKTVCSSLVCTGDTADKGKCLVGKAEKSSKKFDSTGAIIAAGKVCCE